MPLEFMWLCFAKHSCSNSDVHDYMHVDKFATFVMDRDAHLWFQFLWKSVQHHIPAFLPYLLLAFQTPDRCSRHAREGLCFARRTD